MKTVLTSLLFFVALLFWFTPFVAPTLYASANSFVMIFIMQWALSSILWAEQFGRKKTLLLWIAMNTALVAGCFVRDRIVFHFGHDNWYHSPVFYLYAGVPTALYWWIYRSMAAKKKNPS